jgi:uncharacterized protein YcaQ
VTTQSISAAQARAIAVRAQGLARGADAPRTPDAVLQRTSAVQLDTISVLARSHELVAYARLGAVERKKIEAAYWAEPARAFEYYAHANCIMPLELWPYFSFRRGQLGRGVWPQLTGTPVFEEVRARLAEGPVTASDVGGARKTAGWWNWSAAKQALEVMYARGDVIVTQRRNWKRVYDLPERVLPVALRSHRELTPEECYRHLVRTAITALGIGTRGDIGRYFQLLALHLGRTIDRHALLNSAIEENELEQVGVQGWKEPAYVDGDALRVTTARTRSRTTLLSPFDSLIWERERTTRLFGYDFVLEAYKPKHTRVHGYFTMPLLSRNRIVGHVDPAREGRTLVARNVALHEDGAMEDMAAALREAASWVGCDGVKIDRAGTVAEQREFQRLVNG